MRKDSIATNFINDSKILLGTYKGNYLYVTEEEFLNMTEEEIEEERKEFKASIDAMNKEDYE